MIRIMNPHCLWGGIVSIIVVLLLAGISSSQTIDTQLFIDEPETVAMPEMYNFHQPSKWSTWVRKLERFINATELDKEPDEFQEDLVKQHGFLLRNYTIVTGGGYKLVIHRILAEDPDLKNPGYPVLLLHGLLGGSSAWLVKEEDSLPLLLAAKGYDVWLANQRGNYYSNGHTQYTSQDPRFWTFSFHETAIEDIPALIDFILLRNGQSQLYLIGYSMGTTEILSLLSLKPEYNSKTKTAILLAPVAMMDSDRHPLSIKMGLKILDQITKLYIKHRKFEFMPRTTVLTSSIRSTCSKTSKLQPMCIHSIGSIVGHNKRNVDRERIADQIIRYVAGASIHVLIHLAQLYRTGFRLYDRGQSQNWFFYESELPPLYPLEKVTAPIVLIHGPNDKLVDKQSISKLEAQLSNLVLSHKVRDRHFNHLDFVYGINAKTMVYDGIINFMTGGRKNNWIFGWIGGLL